MTWTANQSDGLAGVGAAAMLAVCVAWLLGAAAAALCARKGGVTRDLAYRDLRQALEGGGVYFEG